MISSSAAQLQSAARGSLKSRFSHAKAERPVEDDVEGLTAYLLVRIELAGPVWATSVAIVAALRASGKVAGEHACRSIIVAPGLGDAEDEVNHGLEVMQPVHGTVAALLPHAFDAMPHGGIFKHPAFHAKLVCEPGKGPVMAWYVWQHRFGEHRAVARKGGPRIIYP